MHGRGAKTFLVSPDLKSLPIVLSALLIRIFHDNYCLGAILTEAEKDMKYSCS